MHQHLDQTTWEHLQTWLQNEVDEFVSERRTLAEADIMLALDDDPSLLERHSWPEIQELGRCLRDYEERKRQKVPHHWAHWKIFQVRIKGFICWAEPAPRDLREERYAVAQSGGGTGLVWVRVSPNPDVCTERSVGAFYDIPEEGKEALPWAIDSALRHKRKIQGAAR